jgi:hypothetical protein
MCNNLPRKNLANKEEKQRDGEVPRKSKKCIVIHRNNPISRQEMDSIYCNLRAVGSAARDF